MTVWNAFVSIVSLFHSIHCPLALQMNNAIIFLSLSLSVPLPIFDYLLPLVRCVWQNQKDRNQYSTICHFLWFICLLRHFTVSVTEEREISVAVAFKSQLFERNINFRTSFERTYCVCVCESMNIIEQWEPIRYTIAHIWIHFRNGLASVCQKLNGTQNRIHIY